MKRCAMLPLGFHVHALWHLFYSDLAGERTGNLPE